MKLCDNCKDATKPAETYRLLRGQGFLVPGTKIARDLCDECLKPVLEAIDSKPSPAREPADADGWDLVWEDVDRNFGGIKHKDGREMCFNGIGYQKKSVTTGWRDFDWESECCEREHKEFLAITAIILARKPAQPSELKPEVEEIIKPKIDELAETGLATWKYASGLTNERVAEIKESEIEIVLSEVRWDKHGCRRDQDEVMREILHERLRPVQPQPPGLVYSDKRPTEPGWYAMQNSTPSISTIEETRQVAKVWVNSKDGQLWAVDCDLEATPVEDIVEGWQFARLGLAPAEATPEPQMPPGLGYSSFDAMAKGLHIDMDEESTDATGIEPLPLGTALWLSEGWHIIRDDHDKEDLLEDSKGTVLIEGDGEFKTIMEACRIRDAAKPEPVPTPPAVEREVVIRESEIAQFAKDLRDHYWNHNKTDMTETLAEYLRSRLKPPRPTLTAEEVREISKQAVIQSCQGKESRFTIDVFSDMIIARLNGGVV